MEFEQNDIDLLIELLQYKKSPIELEKDDVSRLIDLIGNEESYHQCEVERLKNLRMKFIEFKKLFESEG